MARRLLTMTLIGVVGASTAMSAIGRIKQHGRAIVEYHSEDVVAVASYLYSQRTHDGAWLLVEFAVQATPRIAVNRNELTLLGPGERTYPLATQPQFLEDSQVLTPLLQNAAIWRRPLSDYFSSRPAVRTIHFFAAPGGGVIQDSAVTNLDEVATGDLFFKSPDGKWSAGDYRLVLNHAKVKAELPIVLD
jgi:hypothetical protein